MTELRLGFVGQLLAVGLLAGGIIGIAISLAQAASTCPCFTSAMIDAALFSMKGTLQNDEIPIPPNANNECTGPEGSGISRLETEFVIYTTDNGAPSTELFVGTGFIDEPLGTCEIFITHQNGDEFAFKVGGRGVPEDARLTVGQVAACQQQILNSLTWRQFCTPSP